MSQLQQKLPFTSRELYFRERPVSGRSARWIISGKVETSGGRFVLCPDVRCRLSSLPETIRSDISLASTLIEALRAQLSDGHLNGSGAGSKDSVWGNSMFLFCAFDSVV